MLCTQNRTNGNTKGNPGDEMNFVEFRRKVRSSEVLSAAIEQLLAGLRFTGRVSVVLENGRVLKSGYEEGYFRQHGEREAV
jgi:hypothetical protein